MGIWRRRIGCWIPKAANAYSEHVILIAFPRQQWLYERCSVLLYTYVACLVWMWCDPRNTRTYVLCLHNNLANWRMYDCSVVHVVLIRFAVAELRLQ